MIITISGNPGSGKSSVSKIVASRLGLKRYYMGQILRDIARKRSMDINQLMEEAKTDPSIDIDLDNYQKRLGMEEDNFIVEGRTSYHFIPHSIKIFLWVDWNEGAKRIIKDMKEKGDDRNEEYFPSIKEESAWLQKRHEDDRQRYLKYYGTDISDMANYDIVIDTTSLSIESAAQTLLNRVSAIRNEIEKGI